MESPPGLQKALVSQGFEDFYACSKRWAGHLRATNWFTFEHPGLPQALGANCARRTGRRQIVEVSPVEWWGLGVAEGSPLGDPASQTTAKGSPQSRSAACPPRRQPITRQSQRLVGHGEDRGLFDGVPGRCVPMRSNRVWSRSYASGGTTAAPRCRALQAAAAAIRLASARCQLSRTATPSTRGSVGPSDGRSR